MMSVAPMLTDGQTAAAPVATSQTSSHSPSSATERTTDSRQGERQKVRQLHEKRPTGLLGQRLITAVLFGVWVGCGLAWYLGWWPLTVVLWLVAAHLSHMKTIALHEAAHKLLSNDIKINELMGVLLGTFAFVPLSAYRFVHHSHHAYLGTRRDDELWPFTDPRAGRMMRMVAAFSELFLGVIYSPLHFFRGVIVGGGLKSQARGRILAEYAICFVFWGGVAAVTAACDGWIYLFVGYVIPAALAGFFQTLRKYIEHMGLFGDSPLTLTRSIVARGRLGRLFSLSLMHEDNHGAHHLFPRIPYRRLPEAIGHFYDSPKYHPRTPLFASYLHALIDMLPHLADPKIGRQWKGARS